MHGVWVYEGREAYRRGAGHAHRAASREFSVFGLDHEAAHSLPPFQRKQASCSIYDLLGEFTKLDLISDYACRKCSLLATRDKLVAQRDRLALALPPPPPPPSSSPPNAFEIPPPPPPPTAAPAMTQSRKDRRKKVQKLVDRVASAIAAGDFERELGDDIKVERVEGPAGRQVRFARVRPPSSSPPFQRSNSLTRQTPEVLTFHINRSSHFGRAGGAFKNPCQVTFPESLDFAPYCDYASPSSPSSSSNTPPSTPQRDLYRLSSLVVHYGSHSFGHYVAFRRRPPSPSSSSSLSTSSSSPSPDPSPSPSNSRLEWYRISDETVQPASIGDALRSNPFLMFYERVEAGVGDGTLGEEWGKGGGRAVVPRLVESWRLGGGRGSGGDGGEERGGGQDGGEESGWEGGG